MKFIHLLNLGYDNQSWTILKSKMFVEANNSKKCFLFFEMIALLKKKNTLHFVVVKITSIEWKGLINPFPIYKTFKRFFLMYLKYINFFMFMNISLKREEKDLTWHYFKMGNKLIFFLKSYKFTFFLGAFLFIIIYKVHQKKNDHTIKLHIRLLNSTMICIYCSFNHLNTFWTFNEQFHPYLMYFTNFFLLCLLL